ncbi:hypothetical protein D9M72_578630 [compost metagenome]
MMEDSISSQPASQDDVPEESRLAQLYTDPATGYRPASSAKHSATISCPAKTSGQDQA